MMSQKLHFFLKEAITFKYMCMLWQKNKFKYVENGFYKIGKALQLLSLSPKSLPKNRMGYSKGLWQRLKAAGVM